MLDQAARNHDRLDEGLDDQMTAEFLHDDHGRERPAAKPADLFGKRRGQQAEFGESVPLLAAETVLAREDLAARVEIITVAQQALNAGSQQFLLFRELDIHPILLWQPLEHDAIRRNRHHALALCLSMIFSENRFPLFRIML